MDWTNAHAALCQALINFREADGQEEEALSAVDDVYHESDEHYDNSKRTPKPKQKKS